MNNQFLQALASRVQACVRSGEREGIGQGGASQPVASYTAQTRWQQERETVFRRYPMIAARGEDLTEPGQWLGLTLASVPVLLARDANGQLRAFLNACRHRGTQLLEPGERHCNTTISCPYHGWTYAADGRLRGLPHAGAFADLDRAVHGLARLPCAERHGFIWVCPAPNDAALDIQSWLGEIDDDFCSFELSAHVSHATGHSSVRANWKLCIDAFLEGYHLRVLHRDSVGPYFKDAFTASDAIGPHYRIAVARASLPDTGTIDLRQDLSFAYFIFPNQIFVVHPDYISQMSVMPTTVHDSSWCHRMLIPATHQTAALQAHWDASFQLIEGQVFQAEDLHCAERMQRGLESGANEHLLFGELERLLIGFHASLDIAANGDGQWSRLRHGNSTSAPQPR